MVNVYKIRVYGALIMSPLITVIAFVVVAQFYGFFWGLAGMAGGLLISVIISKVLINNPFSMMLEGAGILVHNLDSTGIIRPFLVQVASPYINNQKEGVNDVFDRNAVYQYATPLQARKAIQLLENGGIKITLDKAQMLRVKNVVDYTTIELNLGEYKILEQPKKGLFGWGKSSTVKLEIRPEGLQRIKEITGENITIIELDEKEYNQSRFALWHYPALIWNDQIKTMLTKDFLSAQEKEAFAEHNILYLNRKMEELNSAIRDFGRYVVELTKPKGDSWLQSKWVWIIIAIAVVIIIAIFAPSIISAIKGGAGAAAKSAVTTVGNAAGSAGTIIPR